MENFKYHAINVFRFIMLWVFRIIYSYKFFNYKDKIPKDSDYCYIVNEITKNEAGVNQMKVHQCPFWKNISGDLCILTGSDCSGDSVKDCGINRPNEEDYIID
jgi:hypothetical protein